MTPRCTCDLEVMMAASVVSVPLSSNSARDLQYDMDADEDLNWVLPSEVDCLGRTLAKYPFTVTLRKKLTYRSLKAYVAKLRQPRFL